MTDTTTTDTTLDFIERWKKSGASERANAQLFLSELCDFLGVEHPDPSREDIARNAYVFERDVFFDQIDGTTSCGRIDLYKRGSFVLETKQGVLKKEAEASASWTQTGRQKKGHGVRGSKSWDKVMVRAKNQAEGYIRALPAEEGRPPFLIVVDVGHVIELYSEFTRTGGVYTPYPDARSHRLSMDDLADEATQALLRTVWTDPMGLDPSRVAAQVTRDIARHLAELARRLEGQGHDPETAARFLMRCLFTMFAEDVGLLEDSSFTTLLSRMRDQPEGFVHSVQELWEKMNTGGYSVALQQKIRHFNGGLFADSVALPLDVESIELLQAAARCDWRDVEPAIFGTLLERALAPEERHKLGAHFTPRAYVERLVIPTIMEPLREEWAGVQAAAALHLADDKKGAKDKALKEIRAFHNRLCTLRVLDPACGTGNFLYVALEHMKRLEGEVLDLAADLGAQYRMEGRALTVDPHQFLGLEVNPRAAAIAELVLWIGYLQWHFRTYGDVPPEEPIIRDFHNIERRDALLEWDRIETVTDENGEPVTRWDGATMKTHPTTGQEVPDESARVEEVRYVNPREAHWPEAEFVVGNPPFIGGSWKRSVLGSGMFDALAAVYPQVPESADFVMYWWDKAATLVRAGKVRRFGFITTNSLRQVFNRRVLERHMQDKKPVSLAFAIPDHPWVDDADGAAVRIAMTVAAAGERTGLLATVTAEEEQDGLAAKVFLANREGKIWSNLAIGADVAGAKPLRAMEELSCPGVKLHGAGFIVTPEEAASLGLGKVPGLERHIRPYLNGRDLLQRSRGVMVIDLFGLEAEEVRARFPAVYQWVAERVKPDRDAKADGGTKDSQQYAKLWWLFGKTREALRNSLADLPRYIATVETAKHRVFVFLDAAVLPDNKLLNIASADAYTLGVLSSHIHVTWALAQGSRLGVGNDPVYVKTRCFETFPFPDATEAQKERIRELGERLDAHRKARQAEHPDLTLTGMYNVLEKLRAGEALTNKERTIHEQGLVTLLREIHDELDAAVCEAYGWPVDINEDDVLERLVQLNAERAAEEKRGRIRWLRPEYQNPEGVAEEDVELTGPVTAAPAVTTKRPWPKELPDRARLVREVLAAAPGPVALEDVRASFKNARIAGVTEILEIMASLGQVRKVDDGVFQAA